MGEKKNMKFLKSIIFVLLLALVNCDDESSRTERVDTSNDQKPSLAASPTPVDTDTKKTLANTDSKVLGTRQNATESAEGGAGKTKKVEGDSKDDVPNEANPDDKAKLTKTEKLDEEKLVKQNKTSEIPTTKPQEGVEQDDSNPPPTAKSLSPTPKTTTKAPTPVRKK